MPPVQSGSILIVIGIVMNLLGRLALPAVRHSASVPLAGLMAAWMIASVVVALFGLYRLIVGLARR